MHPDEKIENTKGIICSSKSKKDTQYSDQKKKDKQRYAEDLVTWTSLKPGGELGCSMRPQH